MKEVITTERLPIKLWLKDLDEDTLDQARNLANLPFTYKWISIMPDSHLGYGMPIGGVLCTEDVVVPNAVGVDIGCGMCAVKTEYQETIPIDIRKKIMSDIRQMVPTGRKHHNHDQDEEYMPQGWKIDKANIIHEEYDSALRQVGTLGGGNHFIEIQQDQDGYIWLMIHSGSRNIGYTVAQHYHQKAVELCNMWESEVPEDLSFFPKESPWFEKYTQEMNYCIDFAFCNRKLMMKRVKEAMVNHLGPINFGDVINKPHNFASIEYHYGNNVYVHRKGATRAREGEVGMIPGSQGAPSYIVEGLGNELSFDSCSHGAGRQMGRREAKRSLDLEKEKEHLEDLGTVHTLRNNDDLDEAPGSYKDINEVMSNQQDLVDIKHKLTPLATIKG